MTHVHRVDRKDVDAAFARYKALTGDEEATLKRITAGQTVVYSIESEAIAGAWMGAAASFAILDAYANGFEAGLAAADPERYARKEVKI